MLAADSKRLRAHVGVIAGLAARTCRVSVLREFGARAPLLHVKDGPATLDGAMVALGEGQLDIPGIVAASGTNTEWLIVELDRCDTDMMTAVETSYCYLQQLA